MKRFLPSAPISGGLFLSYKCNASCKHCIYASSPKWESDWISLEEMEDMFTILADKIMPSPYGPNGVSFNHGFHFTGGEPFLNFDLLLKGIETAHKFGIPSLFVETNAFWCRDDELTTEKMQQLKDAGLVGILVSVNPFTLETVPFERTARAVRIGSNIFGQGLMVYQVEYFRQFSQLGVSGWMSLQEYLQKVGLREATSRIELLPIGRAVYALSDWYQKYPASRFFGADCSAEFRRNYHNHWDNYGNVLPGFCAGIALGNLKEHPSLYEDGLDLENDYPILNILFENRVGGLFKFAQEKFGYQALESGYVSQCHLCVDIRKQIVSQTQEFKELRPLEFYAQIDSNA